MPVIPLSTPTPPLLSHLIYAVISSPHHPPSPVTADTALPHRPLYYPNCTIAPFNKKRTFPPFSPRLLLLSVRRSVAVHLPPRSVRGPAANLPLRSMHGPPGTCPLVPFAALSCTFPLVPCRPRPNLALPFRRGLATHVSDCSVHAPPRKPPLVPCATLPCTCFPVSSIAPPRTSSMFRELLHREFALPFHARPRRAHVCLLYTSPSPRD